MTISLALYLFAVQFFAFIIKGLVGFGNPLLSGPLLAMQWDNRVITPGNLLMDLPANAYIVFKNRRFFDAKTTLPVTLCILLGVIPGTLLLKMGASWLIKALLGVCILLLGAEMWTRDATKKVAPSLAARTIISFASGVMAGLFGINLLFLAYFERVAESRQQFRTNICFVFLIENTFRALLYLANGMFTSTSLAITAISIPAAILGMLVAGRIDGKIEEKRTKKMVIVVFLLGGVSILFKALIFHT